MEARARLAYIVYWGATEWLGEAVAAPSAMALARHYDVTFVTFEKPRDATPARTAAMSERLGRSGVDWIPLRYRKRPPVVSSFLDAAAGTRALRAAHGRRPFDVVLARTYVAGISATGACRSMSVPLVYYLDACWPEEQVDHGHWRPGSFRYRAARALEDRTLRACSGLLTLTDAARRRILDEGRVPRGLPIAVAPTVSDLVDAATTEAPRRPRDGGPLRLVYLGSFGGRKPVSPLLDLLEAAQAVRPGTTLRVVTDQDARGLLAAAGARGLRSLVEVGAVPHERVGALLAGQDVGLVFLEPGRSACCQTPTKVGEYLAFGLPVVCNPAVGDVPGLLGERDVGVVLERPGPDEARRVVPEIVRLAQDPELPARARAAARARYSMAEVTARQVTLIEEVLASRGAAPGAR